MEHVCLGIQARLSSSRLKRKTEFKFKNYQSMLDAVLEKWRAISPYPVFVLAPIDERNDAFWKNFEKRADVFYGDPYNLIQRYFEFSCEVQTKTIVRLTADNPFVHNEILLKTLSYHFENSAHYTSSKRDDGAIIPYGLGIEVFEHDALEKVRLTQNLEYQEHVSEAFFNDPTIKSQVLHNPLDIKPEELNNLSFTIDELYQFNFWNNLQ